MHSQRWAWTHRFARPMFVTALLALLVSTSAWIAALALLSGGAPTADADCLIGRWQTVSQTEEVPLSGVPLAQVGAGPETEYRADGTGVSDHGAGTRQEGGNVVVEMYGQVEFEYEAADGVFRYLSQTTDGGATITVSGIPVEQPLRYVESPFAYRCDGDTLHFSHDARKYEAELRRVDG